METFALLKKLTEAPGPTGNESGIAAVVEELWRPFVDQIVADRAGSLAGIKYGSGPDERPRPSILLAAHQDELGLMVSHIIEYDGNGFLRVLGLGGVDRRQLLGQVAVVHGLRPLTGVLGVLPDSYLPAKKRGQSVTWDDLVLDVGLSFDQLRTLVSVGDFVTFRQPLRQLQNGRVTGKALDNRASITAVTICLEQLQGRQHLWDVVAVATSQEEETYLGAYTSAYSRRPDAAIAIDVTHAKGPGANESELNELGGGPVLDIGVNVHPGLYKALRDAAKAIEMTVQTGVHGRASGTDAYAVQVSREGIPTGLVSIPLRYMHTMVETADLVDIERTGRLLAEVIARLDDTFLSGIKEELMRPRNNAKPMKD
ncbi:MAG: M20/M25/M40 family metallo-hydrolase [Anaerolineae bacterium]|nr:M20/M25/M40 family metallo-hydrolase [Anaerolineae bacterium]